MSAFSLDHVLLEIPTLFGVARWTTRQAVEGVQIFGGIGSGKTSGSGRTLALRYLTAGFGGLVLTAKPDEKALWQQYCELTGRTDDLIILEPGGPHRFNFLHYEATQGDGQQAFTENIVQVLKTVINAGEEKKGGKSDDAFWDQALDMLIINVIDLCQLAYGTLSVKEMYDIVQSIPKAADHTGAAADPEAEKATPFGRAYLRAKARVDAQVETWKASLPHELSADEYELLRVDDERYYQALFEAVPAAQLLKLLYEFFLGTLKSLSERTRSTIDLMFSGFLFRLLREPVYSLFCRGTSTVTPDASLAGKIILLDLPVKRYQKVGQDCQVMFKYIWQRAMEKRPDAETGRPVFLWADEAQNFLHEHDATYQATARSSRIATVYLSQNLPNYHANMGGAKSESRVKSFLGTLNTKIFHANADLETNRYASALIGQALADKLGESINVGAQFNQGYNRHQEWQDRVRPEAFARLKTGGPAHAGEVEGYVLWQGNSLLPERNHLKVSFYQEQAASPAAN